MLSAFAICETMNFLASASALPLSPSSFQQHSIQRLNLLKTSGCKPTNFLLLRYLCKLTFSWGELRGEDANKRNVVCLTPLQKKLQFSSQDEKYVGWTFWRWGGANLRIPFHSQFANHKYKQVKLRSASHCQWKMRSGFDTAKTKKQKQKQKLLTARAEHCKSFSLQEPAEQSGRKTYKTVEWNLNMPSLGLKPGLPDRQWLAGRLPKLENVKSRGHVSITWRKGFQHALVPGFPAQREFQTKLELILPQK